MENGISVGLSGENRKFGLIVGGVFLVLSSVSFFKNSGLNSFGRITFLIALPLIILGFLMPHWLTWPRRIWIQMGHVLGTINSRIILGVIFYVFITPVGLLMRLLGNDSMRRTFDKSAKTYRILSEGKFNSENMKRPF